MPELPEVETIRRGLEQKIVGLKIKELEVLNAKTFSGVKQKLFGQKVLKVWRKAKALGLDLSGGNSLVFHLKMSGQIIFDDQGKRLSGGHPTQDMRDQMPNKSTRAIFTFADGGRLFFNDQRKFGWIKLIPTEDLDQNDFLKGLGPEPLEPNFSWQLMKERLLKHKTQAVKVALMDQQAISGIGNIYASEACFDAKIDPRRQVSSLNDDEFQALHRGVIKSLKDGIKHGGSSRAHFVNSEGEKGYFLDYAFVYGRQGQPCKVCRQPIQKTQLGGRGTYFCAHCQR